MSIMKISAIYKIQSVIKPERLYIGSAKNITRRWSIHLYNLRNKLHHSLKLQRHYDKYGEADLVFSILLGCEIVDLISTEQYFLDSFNPYFNNTKKAGSTLGNHHTDETKKKISLKNKGKKRTDDCKFKLHLLKVGKDNHRTGLKHKDETRLKMVIAHQKTKHYLLGLHLPEATKVKISSSHRGKTISEATRNKMRESHKGIKHTEESKKKMSRIKKEMILLKHNKVDVA